MTYNIAVIDIGKTNKKMSVYDSSLKCLHSIQDTFEEYEKDGIIYEDIEGINRWMWTSLRELAAEFDIEAVSVTTHGATAVCVNDAGENAVPLVAYTHEPGKEFHSRFFSEFGNPVDLQKETCTPDFSNLINLGKSICFRKQQFPGEFGNVTHILNFPQYFGYLLTGSAAAEYTYVGCHTYLWNFGQNRYSSVAEGLGITGLLPDRILNPWDVLGTISPEAAEKTGLPETCRVTAGIHDSNSSLLPYLITEQEDFILNSTGTWCVAMRPSDSTEFEEEELGSFVFYNLSGFGTPVKTTIFLGGMEFDAYTDVFRTLDPSFEFTPFSSELTGSIVQDKHLFITPTVIRGTGMFPKSEPRIIAGDREFPLNKLADLPDGADIPVSSEELYAALNLSLAIQSATALQRAGASDGTSVFIEGGFRNNDSFASVLTGLFPNSDVSFTDLKEATSFGAALTGKCAVEGISPNTCGETVHISYEPVERSLIPGLEEYAARYTEIITAS